MTEAGHSEDHHGSARRVLSEAVYPTPVMNDAHFHRTITTAALDGAGWSLWSWYRACAVYGVETTKCDLVEFLTFETIERLTIIVST